MGFPEKNQPVYHRNGRGAVEVSALHYARCSLLIFNYSCFTKLRHSVLHNQPEKVANKLCSLWFLATVAAVVLDFGQSIS